jgi:hypothetical protein
MIGNFKLFNAINLIIVIIFFNGNICLAKSSAGLILSGIDTLEGGFDFLLQRPCTSSTDISCKAHFDFLWDHAYIGRISTSGGRMLDLGKMNLDSIKSAPADSVMKDDLGLGQPYIFFRIASDSLKKCIGNVYILKTGIDPRRGNHLYAKIKILNFLEIDIVIHQLKMVFLWVNNRSGFQDLSSTGLDTFHLDSTPIISQNNRQIKYNNLSHTSGGQFVFKVFGDRFNLPQEILGKVKSFTAYDLQGRKLGRIKIDKTSDVNSFKIVPHDKIIVVKMD